MTELKQHFSTATSVLLSRPVLGFADQMAAEAPALTATSAESGAHHQTKSRAQDAVMFLLIQPPPRKQPPTSVHSPAGSCLTGGGSPWRTGARCEYLLCAGAFGTAGIVAHLTSSMIPDVQMRRQRTESEDLPDLTQVAETSLESGLSPSEATECTLLVLHVTQSSHSFPRNTYWIKTSCPGLAGEDLGSEGSWARGFLGADGSGLQSVVTVVQCRDCPESTESYT